MPVAEVFLHVGPPKTGSTYLQRLLWLHREDLSRQDVLVPLAHPNEMWLAADDVQDGAFVRTHPPEGRGAWARVTGRAMAFAGRSVLSSELLGLSTDAHVERIVTSLASADVHVVVMARSLAATLPSLWQETVKMADPDSAWPDFLAAQRDDRSPWTDWPWTESPPTVTDADLLEAAMTVLVRLPVDGGPPPGED